jgi:Astacin (Peptidase family M12A)
MLISDKSLMKTLHIGSIFIGLLATFSCKTKPGSDSESSGLYEKGAGWSGASVEVCFADAKPENAEWRRLVEQVLEEEVNERTNFRFTGFGMCSGSPRAKIEVIFQERAEYHGKSSIGAAQGKMASFLSHIIPNYKARNQVILAKSIPTFGKWKAVKSHEMQSVILHEFSHAMGLHHEHVRSDNSDGSYCADRRDQTMGKQKELAPNAVQVGKYDIESVMNHWCHPNFANRFLSLSRGDVATVNTLYPKGPGNNRGYQFRCESAERLRECLVYRNPDVGIGSCYQKHDDGSPELKECLVSCVIAACRGGELVCGEADKLLACAKAEGGNACFDAGRGDCH